jgi:hypothetical protein
MSIDDRVILVDYERARVMQGWIPRRLGKYTHGCTAS